MNEIYILHGSQTGQAETIAENIHEAAETNGIKSSIMSLQKAEEAFRIVTKCETPVVFVCSTTGDGELPGNARKFMRILGRKTHSSDLLVDFRYALLGLGDTNYSSFCGGPKTLEKGLKKLGATRFYQTGYADDGTDMELVVEPWIEGLWDAVKTCLRQSLALEKKEVETLSQNSLKDSVVSQKEALLTSQVESISALHSNFKNLSLHSEFLHLKESLLRKLAETDAGTLPPLMQSYISYQKVNGALTNDFLPYPLAVDENLKPAKVVSIEKLTADNAVKTAYYVTLDIGSDFVYQPGDSFGVIVKNPKVEVDWLIKRLNLENECDDTITLTIDDSMKRKKLPKYIPSITTIRYIFENCVEIRSVPKRTFLRALFDFTSSDDDKNILRQLCHKESMDDFSKFMREPNLNILDLLAVLPSCNPPFTLLVEHLPRIKARLYSAASSLEAAPNFINFVFNVVDFPVCDGRMYPRKGIFTGFMDLLYKNCNPNFDTVLSIFKTKNSTFHLPDSLDAPLVMIGPGTGVAPFVGFLEFIESRCRSNSATKRGKTLLFFGCRNKEKDFLFREKLESFVESGTLTHLMVAFSRDGSLEDGGINPKYVQDNLRLKSDDIIELLQGDALFFVCGDARNMAKDVRKCLVDILSVKMTVDGANEFIISMVKEGRYKEDVWT